MNQYFTYYASANVVGVIFFGLMLAHDMRGIDRQEKQIKYGRVLGAFMLYFLSDIVWAGVLSGVFPQNPYSVVIINFINYINMSLITYTWLDYVMAVEQSPHRNRPINRFAVVFPFLICSLALIVVFIISPRTLINSNLTLTPVYYGFMLAVPYIYLIAVIIYTMKRAVQEEDHVERRKHIFLGLLPVAIVAGGMVQTTVAPDIPVFTYCSIIIMFIFYMQSMDSQISTDPLTRLNNRGQIMRYVSQASNLRIEGRPTFIVMLDINNFKKINDCYGHAEGDKALIIIADALVDVIKGTNFPVFLGRYGGDEFVIIAYPSREDELENMLISIRKHIEERCRMENKPYNLSVAIGYDELLGEQDSFQKCLQRADNKLYINKDFMKVNGRPA